MATAPIIATGNSYEPYLIAARQNIDALVKLATEFGDAEFVSTAQSLLDGFDTDAGELTQLIDEANAEPADRSDDEADYRYGQMRDEQALASMGWA